MTPPADSKVVAFFSRLPQGVQTAALVLLIGVILFLALALDSSGETAFLYATF